MNRVTTSFSMWSVQADLVKDAADAKGVNCSEYFREYIVPFIAGELGRKVPVTPRMSTPAAGNGAHESGTYNAIDIKNIADEVVKRLTQAAK